MKLITGNLWTIQTQVKVIPTNGVFRKADGKAPEAIMGAGVAKQAKEYWPLLPFFLGERLEKYGNKLFIFDVPPTRRASHVGLGCVTLVTLPTKNEWKAPSTEDRLILSLRQLAAAQRMHDWAEVYLPELGTGHGGLTWETVEPIMSEYLSDVFTVVRLEKP